MRYSTLHEPGVKPPANTLDAEAWRDLEPKTKGGTHFKVVSDDGSAFTIRTQRHTEQVARTLAIRPLKSASRCRISQYVAALREMGVEIDTEGFKSDDKGRESYGVYFLKSKLVEVQK